MANRAYIKPGSMCLVWEPADIQKQLWFYSHHLNGIPVFISKWPEMKDEQIAISWPSLQYQVVAGPFDVETKYCGLTTKRRLSDAKNSLQ